MSWRRPSTEARSGVGFGGVVVVDRAFDVVLDEVGIDGDRCGRPGTCRGDHPSVDQLDTCQPVVVNHQPGDLAGHDLDAAGFELGHFDGGQLVRSEATA